MIKLFRGISFHFFGLCPNLVGGGKRLKFCYLSKDAERDCILAERKFFAGPGHSPLVFDTQFASRSFFKINLRQSRLQSSAAE